MTTGGELSLNCLTTPDTGIKLMDGSVVKLARFPNMKWIVHNGWYTYNGQQFVGWYFCSIPSQTIIPVNEEDLRLLTLVANSCNCPDLPLPPQPCPEPDNPHCHPDDNIMLHRLAHELDKAFLSVDTIAQRNQLNRRLLPDGKLVRVNDVDGQVKYYAWNQVKMDWEEADLGSNTSNDYITKEEADASYATTTQVSEISSAVTWEYL